MSTVNMDRLLQACVEQDASDIHITVGKPPVFRVHGRLRSLETKVIMTLFPFIVFATMIPIILARKRSPQPFPLIKALVDRLFSAGAYERIGGRTRFHILAAVFFMLAGVIGVIRSLVIDAPEMNLYFCVFVLSGGLGVTTGLLIFRAMEKRRT